VRGRGLLPVLLLLGGGCHKAPGPSPSPPPSLSPRPNVLLITIDTLRADHLGFFGYTRATSPALDRFGSTALAFDNAFTYWPKTRGSMVVLLTGTTPSTNGYSRSHPVLFPFNTTLASVLAKSGYTTAAIVDNSNIAAANGYSLGFGTYRQTWLEEGLKTEAARGEAITEGARGFLSHPPASPFFLWLHYVNPHAPYTPPPPFDKGFLDKEAEGGPVLPVVSDFHRGIHKEWAEAAPGHRNLGYFVAEYDGEIATSDHEVGEVLDALRASGVEDRTVVVVLSDHGESLGEHDYYFDHGEDVFRPCLRIPFFLRVPGLSPTRRTDLASTLDLVPTILDAVKVSFPPGLAGRSLLEPPEPHRHLFAQNDRDLAAGFDERFALVMTPEGTRERYALYDTVKDPGEITDVGSLHPEEFRVRRRELEEYLDRREREWSQTLRLTEGQKLAPPEARSCEEMKALGYLPASQKCR